MYPGDKMIDKLYVDRHGQQEQVLPSSSEPKKPLYTSGRTKDSQRHRIELAVVVTNAAGYRTQISQVLRGAKNAREMRNNTNIIAGNMINAMETPSYLIGTCRSESCSGAGKDGVSPKDLAIANSQDSLISTRNKGVLIETKTFYDRKILRIRRG